MNKHFALGLTLVFTSPMALADGHGHSHEAALEAAPHGGVLRDAPPYKAELVLNGDNAKLYVYDKALQPVVLDHAAIRGNLQFPRQSKKTVVTFTRAESGAYYAAKLAGISKTHRYDLHITLEVGAEKVLADFGVDNIH